MTKIPESESSSTDKRDMTNRPPLPEFLAYKEGSNRIEVMAANQQDVTEAFKLFVSMHQLKTKDLPPFLSADLEEQSEPGGYLFERFYGPGETELEILIAVDTLTDVTEDWNQWLEKAK